MARVVCVVLQRRDLNIPWGFRLTGGKDLLRPLIIHKVAAGTLAAQQLKPGDVVLALQDKSTRSLTLHDALELIRTAKLSLEITVHQSPTTLQPLSSHTHRIPTPNLNESNQTMELISTKDMDNKNNSIVCDTKLNKIKITPLNNTNDESSVNFQNRECLPDIVPKDTPIYQQEQQSEFSQVTQFPGNEDLDESKSREFGRQSSQISGAQGNGVTSAPGNGGPPMPPPMPPSMLGGGGPPPPPPLPPPGMPSAKLNAQIADRSRLGPPPAIQAAMIGKDKKPFTYTPGGIDLSEIRSPRMQRRICRNAAAEGVPPPPAPPTPPTLQAGGIPRPPPMHPQLAVAVLPPPPPLSNKADTPPTPSAMKMTPPIKNNNVDYPQVGSSANIINSNETRKPPTSVYIPQPPVMNNNGAGNYNNGNNINNKPVQQTGHIYVAPVTPKTEPTQGITSQLGSLYIPAVPQTPPSPQTPQSQSPASPLQVNLNQAAKPWLNSQNRQPPMSPQNVAPHVIQHVAPRQTPQSPPAGVWSPPNTPSTRIIPIQVEGRESPVNTGPQQSSGARTRVVPIQMEGGPVSSPPPQQQWQQAQQPRVLPVYTHNKYAAGQEQNNVPQSPTPPVQSRSFRVLQRITASDEDGTGGPQGPPVSHTGPPPPPPAQQFYLQQQQQHPKMQLSNDDRQLMDRFKAQDTVAQQEADEGGLQLYRGASIPSRVFRLLDKSVDGETFLHTEADPRYRGAAIPSRAFRMLQTMTEGAPPLSMGQQAAVPGMQGGGNMANVQQSRPEWSSPPPVMMQVRPDTSSPQQQQAYVPASEQGAQPEPRKYTGSCIPSRSFRMLQAMTAPEDCESTENSDVTSEAMYYAPPSPCPSPYSWYYPTEGGSGDPVWDSYIYAYISNYGHCPPGYYYPPHCNNYESDDYSGYSSTEEMAYYGQPGIPPPQHQPSPLTQSEVEESATEPETQDGGSVSTSGDEGGEEGDEDSEDSDTEVEESDDEQKTNRSSGVGLQAIKSVHDIHAGTGLEDEDDSECGSDVEESEGAGRLGAKQLSVIYEESEHSDAESVRRMRWRASRTPALTETEEESSDADDQTVDSNSSNTLQNSNDNIYCDKTRDKNVSDESSKFSNNNKSSKNIEESEESEEESDEEEQDKQVESKPQVTKVSATELEESEEEEDEEEEDERAKNSAGSDAVSEDESEEESDGVNTSNISDNHLKSISADENCVNNTSTNDESSEDEIEHNANKLQTSPTVVEIKKSNTEKAEDESNSSEEDEEEDVEPEATVTVRLPLRLKFSRNSSEEAVTTLIVGDTEQVSRNKNLGEPSSAAAKVEEWMQRGYSESSTNKTEDPQVSVCLSLPLRRKPAPPVETPEAEDSHWEDDSSSTSIQTVRPRCASLADAMAQLPQNQAPTPPAEERLQSPPYNNEEVQHQQQEPDVTNIIEQPTSIKKSKSKDKTSQASEKRAKRTIRRSSTEDDSGVTDLSRQMSDSESEVGAELLACQRAATHSRLFKLLQDACDGEDDEEEETQPRRELLHLPLRSDLRVEHDSSSLSSSGITSPASPTVAARLVRELAKELTRRKGKRQRPARLHAAAMRIMKEEDNDPYDTTTGSSASSDSGGARPSPLHAPSASHNAVAPPMPAAYYPPYPPPPPPHVLAAYGPNYYEYLDYYNSWAAMDPRDYAVVPARAFRVLSNPGASPLDAPYAKCPRIVCPNNSAPAPKQSQSPCHAPTPAS